MRVIVALLLAACGEIGFGGSSHLLLTVDGRSRIVCQDLGLPAVGYERDGVGRGGLKVAMHDRCDVKYGTVLEIRYIPQSDPGAD